jgi:hypothetical protein
LPSAADLLLSFALSMSATRRSSAIALRLVLRRDPRVEDGLLRTTARLHVASQRPTGWQKAGVGSALRAGMPSGSIGWVE